MIENEVENQEILLEKNKNIDKSKIINIGVKKIFKLIDFNQYLINKRNICNNALTFSIPNEMYEYIKDESNRSNYFLNLLKKYEILLKNVDFEVFYSASEFFRFFLYLDYFQFINDLKIEINSINLRVMKIKNEIKNGYITEIENGIEYFRFYENGIKLNEKIIKKQEV